MNHYVLDVKLQPGKPAITRRFEAADDAAAEATACRLVKQAGGAVGDLLADYGVFDEPAFLTTVTA